MTNNNNNMYIKNDFINENDATYPEEYTKEELAYIAEDEQKAYDELDNLLTDLEYAINDFRRKGFDKGANTRDIWEPYNNILEEFLNDKAKKFFDEWYYHNNQAALALVTFQDTPYEKQVNDLMYNSAMYYMDTKEDK